jgi:large subunit ribosomal protein L38
VRTDPALERAAREGALQVDLEVVRNQWVESGQSFDDIYEAAELYGVYEDLFGSAFYRPCVSLGVEWPQAGGERLVPVHRGNLVKPGECATAPLVSWPGPDTALWTLAMVGPDSHLSQPDAEVLHWLVGNVRGSDLATGDTLASYLQPHPPFGTGYHRFVFLLFRQEGPVELEQERRTGHADLAERTFSTLEFYRRLQDQLTPAGLAFCQADYDPSLRGFFHNTLAMKEPRYEYEFPEHYVRPWRNFFPDQERVGFDEFLNRHRDPKDVERQVLEKKLANTSPFTGDQDAELKFPGLHESDLQGQFPPPVGEKRLNPKQSFKIAQWRRNAIMRERRKEGYFTSYDHSALRRDPSSCS